MPLQIDAPAPGPSLEVSGVDPINFGSSSEIVKITAVESLNSPECAATEIE